MHSLTLSAPFSGSESPSIVGIGNSVGGESDVDSISIWDVFVVDQVVQSDSKYIDRLSP